MTDNIENAAVADVSAAGTVDFFRERQGVETPLTIRILEVLPSDKLAYRPHPASQPAADVAWTTVRTLRACTELVKSGKSEMLYDPPPPHDELVHQFKSFSDLLTEQLAAVTQSRWESVAVVTENGKVLLECPLGQLLWLFHFDTIHHRGQLSSYLRPMGAKVPSVYGYSGDAKPQH
jgi:hypothetical protein